MDDLEGTGATGAMGRGMKVAMVQRFLPSGSPGGVGYFTHGLANALTRRGHAVTVFSGDPAPPAATYGVVRLTLPPILRGRKLCELYFFAWLVAQQDFSAFDLVHAQGDDHLLPRRGLPPRVRTFHGSGLAEAVHSGWKEGSPKWFLMFLSFYLFERISARRADLCVAVSEHTFRHLPRARLAIPNGIDLDRFNHRPGSKSPRASILFVGLLGGRKRGRLLAEVFEREVRPTVPGVELWMVCPEPVHGNGIVWHGRVSAETLADLYRKAWVFCLPSSYEAFGRPYLEAMASGTAVVSTANPGSSELLDGGKYGVIAHEKALGETLIRLLEDRSLREGYEARGLARAQEFSWDAVAARYEEVYRQVLEMRARLQGPRREAPLR